MQQTTKALKPIPIVKGKIVKPRLAYRICSVIYTIADRLLYIMIGMVLTMIGMVILRLMGMI